MSASIFDSGAVLAAAVAAFIVFDFAFDETRFEDTPFFVVLGLFMFGLGARARWLAGKVFGPRGPRTA